MSHKQYIPYKYIAVKKEIILMFTRFPMEPIALCPAGICNTEALKIVTEIVQNFK